MRRIHLIGVAVAALMLVAAVAAYAVPSSLTTFDFQSKVTPKKAGTKKKPKAEKVTLTMKGGTTTPTGSPQTTTDFVVRFPSTLKWYGGKWAKSKRCDAAAAQVQKSDSDCPKGSKVGSGSVTATNQSDPTKPKFTEDFTLTAYVLKAGPSPDPDPAQPPVKGGSLGLWLEGSPQPINLMMVARISNKNTKLSIHIPKNAQAPGGTPLGIENLAFTLNGKTKSKGKSYGVMSSVGCKNKKWKTKVTNRYTDGTKRDSDTNKCTAKKKKK